MLVCPVPEQEHAEGHSDRIPLPANPNGLQDPRVFQLAADEVVIKHTGFLMADGHTVTYKGNQDHKVGHVHANNHKKKVWKCTFMLFGLIQRTKKVLHLKCL